MSREVERASILDNLRFHTFLRYSNELTTFQLRILLPESAG